MGYSVYKHTFPNGKVYIGITCQKPEDRWDKGKGYLGQPRMARAIVEYGWDNIEHKVLFDELTEEEAKQLEASLISEYNSNNIKYGYNVSASGISCKEDPGGRVQNRAYMPDNDIVFANQWTVKINNPKHPKDSIQKVCDAMKYLSESALKLYIYFCNNKDGHIMVVSPERIKRVAGISRTSYYTARDELIEKGYLVYKQDKSYDFYVTPTPKED